MPLTRPSIGPVSSPFGYRQLVGEGRTFHGGMDFVGALGSPIRAVKDGVVVESAPNGQYNSYGNLVVIKHDDPREAPYSLYAHLNSRRVRKGQRVKAGQLIGTMGNTSARKTDPYHTVRTHLHFELLRAFPAMPDVGRIDPSPYISAKFTPTAAPAPAPLPAPIAPQSFPYLYPTYAEAPAPLRGLGAIAPSTAVLGLLLATPFVLSALSLVKRHRRHR